MIDEDFAEVVSVFAGLFFIGLVFVGLFQGSVFFVVLSSLIAFYLFVRRGGWLSDFAWLMSFLSELLSELRGGEVVDDTALREFEEELKEVDT